MVYKNGFIKDEDFLEESYRTDDLLDLSDEKNRFCTFLDNIKTTALISFVGRFGSGKSNFLNQIQKKYESKWDFWMEFDAWKYPERTSLWENFVLELAYKIGDEPGRKNTIKIVEGAQNKTAQKLVNIATDSAVITSTLTANPASAFMSKWLWNVTNSFLEHSPAKRTFELQEILKGLLKSIEQENIYFVIEDIDRSSDAGIYFLETLNHFLKNSELKRRIIVIVPIGTEMFTGNEISYWKCLDYRYDFSLENVKLDTFVKALFIDEILANEAQTGQITSFLEGIFKNFEDQITMRLLKKMLREANVSYKILANKYNIGIDWRLSIMFMASKYIKTSDRAYIDNWKTYKDKGTKGSIASGNGIFSALCTCIIHENYGRFYNNIYETGTTLFDLVNPIKIVSYPVENFDNKFIISSTNGLFISDEYLR